MKLQMSEIHVSNGRNAVLILRGRVPKHADYLGSSGPPFSFRRRRYMVRYIVSREKDKRLNWLRLSECAFLAELLLAKSLLYPSEFLPLL